MTTGFGIPVDSKTASQTVGPRGPMLMVRCLVGHYHMFDVAGH